MKIVYNGCFGGFSLSPMAVKRYAEIKGMKIYVSKTDRDRQGNLQLKADPVPITFEDAGKEWMVFYHTSEDRNDDSYWSDRDVDRDDPALVQVVEEMGSDANGSHAKLVIEDVPTGALWRIDEYDGNERVMTQSDYDWKVAR